MNRKAALFAVLALVMSPADATTRLWESYPGIDASSASAVIGDFNGDGRSEAVVGTPQSYQFQLSIFGTNGAGTFGNLGMTVWLNQMLRGQIQLAPREGSADRILMGVLDTTGVGGTWIGIYGEIPMRLLRVIPLPNLVSVVGVADVDADGELEIIAISGTYSGDRRPVVVDYATGAVEWVADHTAVSVAFAQLDADPALELILTGTPGRIIDAASHQVEWTWPAGFRDSVVVGKFAADPSIPTFVSWNQYGQYAQIFRGQPYSPLSEFPQYYETLIERVNWSGTDQLLISQYDRGVHVFDPRTQATLFTWTSDRAGSMFAVGNLDADPNPELILRAIGSNGARLRVIDGATLQDDYSEVGEFGPYSALTRGALGGSATDQVAYIAASLNWPYDTTIRVLDAASGSPLRERTQVGTHYNGRAPLVASGQFDGDAQEEIAVATRNDYQPYVAVLDGVSLLDQWRRTNLQEAAIALELLHINADGVPDIVMATNSGRILVLNGVNGVTLWQSTTIDAARQPSLATFTTTAAEPRIVMGRGRGLYVFDPVGGLVTAVIKTSAEVMAINRWGAGGTCEIGALGTDFVLSIYRCHDLAYLRELNLPTGTRFFRPFDLTGQRFLAASGEVLYAAQAGRDPVVVAGGLGNNAGLDNLGSVIPSPDGKSVDVVLGTGHMITRLRVESDDVFAHGFE